MRSNGRAEDPEFMAAEKLFRRYRQEHYVDGTLSGVALRLREPLSLNREKYSEAEDVLFSPIDEFAGWGVFSVRVQDIPVVLPDEGPQYRFAPKHVPLDENYSHSEIWCDRMEPTGRYVEPNPSVRKLFRTIISQRATREIQATV